MTTTACEICHEQVDTATMMSQYVGLPPDQWMVHGHADCIRAHYGQLGLPISKPPYPGIEYDLLYEGAFYWLLERYRGGDRPWRKVARFDDTNDAHAILRRVRRP